MSGSGASGKPQAGNLPKFDLTKEQLDAYAASGADVSKLRAALGEIRTYNKSSGELSAASYADSIGIKMEPWQREAAGGGSPGPDSYFSTSGQDLTSEVRAFMSWKGATDKETKSHEEYVKLVKDRPGRAATLLTGAPGAQAQGKLFSGLGQ